MTKQAGYMLFFVLMLLQVLMLASLNVFEISLQAAAHALLSSQSKTAKEKCCHESRSQGQSYFHHRC